MKSFNPATNEIVWEGPPSDPRPLIEKGKKSFLKWASLHFEERAAYLENYRKMLEENKDPLALAISKETGKPLWESENEVAAMIGKIPISIQAYKERCPKEFHFRPHGLILILGPFNFPGHLPNGHIVPALLAGNTVIFKPSELAPLTGELINACMKLPEGVFQVAQGDSKVGKILAESPLIDGIFFTGSFAVGEQLKKHSLKILALEMGGNNPLVVSKISSVKEAANIIIQSAYLTSGQRCSAARRLILTPGCPKEALLKELIRQIGGIKIGSYNDNPAPFMGPVIHLDAAKYLLEVQEKLIEQGAKALVKMKLLKEGLPFITPALIDTTSIQREDKEYFGPLLQVIETTSFEEAITEANNTAYGLSAGLLSDSKEEWDLFYQRVRAGVINWNAPLTGASSKAPFGGLGKSGNYRPSAYLAADYCSYPVASIQNKQLQMTPLPGLPL